LFSVSASFNELLELVQAVPELHRMNVLLTELEWEEEDESFCAVSKHWAQILYPQWRGLEIIFQDDAETVHS
jgi:hypothetical protein